VTWLFRHLLLLLTLLAVALDVQKVNGTYRDVHRCDLAVVVTINAFTKAAAAFCQQVGIRTVDQRALALWAEGTGKPPWDESWPPCTGGGQPDVRKAAVR
jgi:hypothetical protein